MRGPIYLDNHATTQLDPVVLDAMLPYFVESFGNAASRSHEFGWRAEAAVEMARKQVAGLINADASEIVFTSGATESVNLALKGAAEAIYTRTHRTGYHILTVATEHRAVLDSCRALEKSGIIITRIAVDEFGRVDVAEIARAMTDDTVMLSVMWANNEIGTIAPIAEIAGVCRSRGILFHSDATQAVGHVPVDVRRTPVDLLSFNAHKMHGPKGIGALYVRAASPRVPIVSQIDGGGHEKGLRSGTLNVPAIVGFGKGAEVAGAQLESAAQRTGALRDRLVEGIRRGIGDISINGHPTERLPHNASITFPGLRAEAMMMAMRDLALSSGAACSSAHAEPSHVLRAIGLTDADASGTLRFGLSRFTTVEEVDHAVRRVVDVVHMMRNQQGTTKNEGARIPVDTRP